MSYIFRAALAAGLPFWGLAGMAQSFKGIAPSHWGVQPLNLPLVEATGCDTNCLMARGLMDQARRAERVVDQNLGSGTQMANCGQLSMALTSYTSAASYGALDGAAEAKRVSNRIARECPYGWPR